ncbi:hypothetical protein INS49_012850 [Diaporthe citri]|uniref:uncharacterized protein n=1 Tax=Diaporthe citri TaxID=83186 RepID=UPI001C812E78|nr:uncharacterized protein INS49_012850 [Diaporthe citri]KAG6359329.1 hypothetical protein INS49_012850 [Diaporthe citri]
MDDTKPRLNLDAAGIFWVSWCGIWTLLVGSGMGFLWYRRDTPLLRIRGLNLSFAAIGFLHTYWMAVQMAYIADPFPPKAEYWIMGIYLPLWHRALPRLEYPLPLHREAAEEEVRSQELPAWGTHAYDLVRSSPAAGPYSENARGDRPGDGAAGEALQLFLTVLMYLLSRKFHPSFGVPGTEAEGSPWDVNNQQARGWEWWPSIIWQFFWSWIVAPVVLWRARRVHDTLGWRTQTLACCLAGLPATPMWLIALYVPGMSRVNRYWIPPQWIAISIMFLEMFSIFLPCWQVWRHQSLRQDTIDMIAAWESKHNNHGEGSSTLGATSVLGKSTSQKTWKTISAMEKASTTESVGTAYSGESMLSMGALEYVLEHNPDPLRQFSALKDFSGENVAFLTAVAEWRSRYRTVGKGEAAREAYNKALHIYVDFISSKDAEFPINISFQVKTSLEAMFEKAARVLYGDRGLANSPATPFAPGTDWPRGEAAVARPSHASERPIIGSRSNSNTHVELRAMTDRVAYWGEIPADFDATIFDKAETSIKYLVLTNTWPKTERIFCVARVKDFIL